MPRKPAQNRQNWSSSDIWHSVCPWEGVRVLVTTPDVDLGERIAERLAVCAAVDLCAGFNVARTRLVEQRVDLLITDIRLAAYNGLHLVHIANTCSPRVRSVVFARQFDCGLAAEAIAAGAFYEHADRIAAAAPSYLRSPLPAFDRRNPASFDRCAFPFGGRRAADLGLTIVARAQRVNAPMK